MQPVWVVQATWPIWLDPTILLPWRSFTTSLVLHGLIFVTVLLHPAPLDREKGEAHVRSRVTSLFVPGRVKEHTIHPKAVQSSTRPGNPRPIEEDSLPVVSDPKVDLDAIKLSFQDDGSGELPEVVRSYNGVFALVDRRDPGFTRYVFEPPDWSVREAVLDMSGKLRFLMSPAYRWAVLREGARRYSLDLKDYDVCAVFERPYAKCLERAIRDRALLSNDGPNRQVQSARLAFAAGKPCGVDILGLTTASVSEDR